MTMHRRPTRSLRVSEIATSLAAPYFGPDFVIEGVCTLNLPRPRCIGFIKDSKLANAAPLAESGAVFLVPQDCAGLLSYPHIPVPSPRQGLMQTLRAIYEETKISQVASTAVIAPDVKIGRNVSIGHFSVIGPETDIGDGTEIRNHVVVVSHTSIGERCVLKSHCTIGEDGLGLENDDEGVPRKIPHIGGVVIGNDVEIGSFNTVCRGTIDATVIGNGAKFDDHVHIAHNCQIGENCIITACAELSGSVKLGNRVWLGPNCSILNGLTIGDDVYVGIGAVVVRDCDANGVYAGCPARRIKERS
jgi:UDP-3-O-[3-hydroxymyristoyl] glucosamine N-acyltransferase